MHIATHSPLYVAFATLTVVMLIMGPPTPAHADGPATQQPETQPAAGKKGACLITVRGRADTWLRDVKALNVHWHYSWGADRPVEKPEGVEFVPMIWGYYGQERAQPTIDKLRAQQQAGTRTHLLGFNEPDGKKQANLSVDKAIEAWPLLESTGLRLGSPAAVHAHRQWMRDFMARAEANGLRVDFVTVHWYGHPNAKGFVRYLKKIHEMYGKPIWITEFAVADWKAKTRAENRHSPQRILAFMKELLPMLDELDFVERYAWFTAQPSNKALGPSALFDQQGNLTELGRFYAQHDKPTRD